MSSQTGEWVFLIFANVALLTLLSYLYSLLVFRRARPVIRALQCCAAGYATLWLVLFGLSWVSFFFAYFLVHGGPIAAAIGVPVISLVFLMLWQSFTKQWSPEAEELAARFD